MRKVKRKQACIITMYPFFVYNNPNFIFTYIAKPTADLA